MASLISPSGPGSLWGADCYIDGMTEVNGSDKMPPREKGFLTNP